MSTLNKNFSSSMSNLLSLSSSIEKGNDTPVGSPPGSDSFIPTHSPTNSVDISEEFNIATFKSFLHKKLQSASSLIKKPKTHTCKVTVVTVEKTLQLTVADGTFMNEGLVFLKGELGQDKSSALFDIDNILELGFEFDLPYDLNSTSMLNEVLALKNLIALTVKTNYIPTVPPQVGLMKNLEYLSLANNQLKIFNEGLLGLRKLTTLNLSNNQLVSIPKEISNLNKLKILVLSSNYITSIPSTINQLTNLRLLELNNNRLSNLPDLTGLNDLEEISLENNLLTYQDPQSDSIIDKVKTMTIGHSNLKTLSTIQSLSVINLRYNKLVCIPEIIISSLPKLQKIDLAYNSIQQVGELSSSSLQILDLSHNTIINISPKVASLVALKELNLSFNMLSSLPVEFSSLNQLKCLKIGNNQLKDRLEIICSLNNLTYLNLCNNGIQNLPIQFTQLTQLQVLNLSKNHLKTLPSKVVHSLSQLKKLDLSDNKLVSLPYSIASLTSLRALRLHVNRITVLPREMALLAGLEELSIKNMYINANGELNIIQLNEDEKNFHLRLNDIISLTRSSPHHLLVYALYLMSEEATFQEKIVHEGGLADMIHLMKHEGGRTQAEATKILANLSMNDANKELIFQEGAVDVILKLLTDSNAETETKIHALITLGNISLSDANRKSLVESLELVTILVRLAHDEMPVDPLIRKYARRTLATFGLLDNVPDHRGLRILALDGGGVRGVATVEILKKIEQMTGKKICELFDIIGGTSAGGWTGACAGMKHFSLDRIQQLQEKLAYEVFAHGVPAPTSEDFFSNQLTKLQSRLTNAAQVLRTGTFYSAKLVEELLYQLLGDELLIDTTMESDNKVFLVSTLATAFPPQIYLWRNYQYPINGHKSRYQGTMTNKIWEAFRATSCAPAYFDEFTIGGDKHQDGGVIANNPTAITIHEAKCLWPYKKIDCIVSIGTGKPPIRENKAGFLERTVVEMIECATSVDRIHELMLDSYPSDVYFRLNPVDERFNCELDESRKEKLEEMREAARDYVAKNEERIQQLVKILTNQQS